MEETILEQVKKLGYQERQTTYPNEEGLKKGEFGSRFWVFPEDNIKLQNTPFYCKENDFTHFTSFEALNSILNSGIIRLYNLIHMDDKFELIYGMKELNFNHDIEKTKKDLYSLSVCSSEKILNNPSKEHLLWRIYGNNGKGAMLRISFQNNLNSWYNYHLAPMSYNFEYFEPLKAYKLYKHG
jgi:hypothetical protein